MSPESQECPVSQEEPNEKKEFILPKSQGLSNIGPIYSIFGIEKADELIRQSTTPRHYEIKRARQIAKKVFGWGY